MEFQKKLIIYQRDSKQKQLSSSNPASSTIDLV